MTAVTLNNNTLDNDKNEMIVSFCSATSNKQRVTTLIDWYIKCKAINIDNNNNQIIVAQDIE